MNKGINIELLVCSVCKGLSDEEDSYPCGYCNGNKDKGFYVALRHKMHKLTREQLQTLVEWVFDKVDENNAAL